MPVSVAFTGHMKTGWKWSAVLIIKSKSYKDHHATFINSARATDSTVSRPNVGTGALSLCVKHMGHETNQSTLSSDEVNNAWSCTFITLYIFIALR